MHLVITCMKNIGVETTDNLEIQKIIDDYPKGWRKYEDNPRMARYMGLEHLPHHSTACGFIDPAGNIVILRLEAERQVPRFGAVWS